MYVAPMKALAQEVQEKFAERLRPLGLSVRELTGDMQLTKREIEMTQVGDGHDSGAVCVSNMNILSGVGALCCR